MNLRWFGPISIMRGAAVSSGRVLEAPDMRTAGGLLFDLIDRLRVSSSNQLLRIPLKTPDIYSSAASANTVCVCVSSMMTEHELSVVLDPFFDG